MKAFYVYMMTNQSRVVLYTGITNSLTRRVWQHQSGEIEGFTKSYKVERLVGRNEESEVGGFIIDALSAFQTFLACFSSYRQTTMIKGSSRTLCVLRGPSLRLGMT